MLPSLNVRTLSRLSIVAMVLLALVWLGQVGYVFGKGGHTLADVKSKAGVNIITDVSREASLPPPSLSHTNWRPCVCVQAFSSLLPVVCVCVCVYMCCVLSACVFFSALCATAVS